MNKQKTQASFPGRENNRAMRAVLGLSIFLCLLAGFLGLGIQPVQAETDEEMKGMSWSNPLPQGNTLNGVTYGNGNFIAVGISGTILRSSDGSDWEPCNSDTTSKDVLNKVAYGQDSFVAVGDLGKILTSTDGINWESVSSGTTSSLYDIAYGDNTFVAVGTSGTLLTSDDGISWTIRNSGTTDWLKGVAYGNDKFVAVGISGSILSSSDGIDWTYSDSPQLLNQVAYGNDSFVAVGFNGCILTSTDGINWNKCDVDLDEYVLNNLTYGNERFVIAETDGSLTSTDGSNWSMHDSSGGLGRINDLTCGNGIFVAVGLSGTILTSGDGIDWNNNYENIYSLFFGVTYGNDKFVAVGMDGMIVSSDDACNWGPPENSGTSNDLHGVSYGNGSFVAVGNGGVILTSSDANEWTCFDAGTTQDLRGVCYGNGRFIAVGDNGTIVSSDDGINWTNCSSGTNRVLNGVAYGRGNFVAVGGGIILSSTDGINWAGNSRSPNWLYGVNYCFNKFVAVGISGTILIGDGHTWIPCSSGTITDLKHATFGNNCFVVVGASGIVLQSPDLVSWSEFSSGTSHSLNDISYGNGTFATVGGRGTILSSTFSAIANNVPQASDVNISGISQIGLAVTGNYTYADAENDPEGNSAFQWFRGTKYDGGDKEAISGANTKNYTIKGEDNGYYLFFEVTPVATLGNGPGQAVLSPALGPVMENTEVSWTDWPLRQAILSSKSLFIKFNQDLDNSSIDENTIFVSSDSEGGRNPISGFEAELLSSRTVEVRPPDEGWPAGENFLFISSRVCSSTGQYLNRPIRTAFIVAYLPDEESWNLEDGWSIVNQGSGPVLTGQGHKWARLLEKEWDNHTIDCRVKILTGGLHINFRNQMESQKRYFIKLMDGCIALHKQDGEGVFNDDMATVSWENDSGWHDIDIRTYQGIINVYVDGSLILVYEDEDYIQDGIIAFESLDDSEVQIADVRIVNTNVNDVSTVIP